MTVRDALDSVKLWKITPGEAWTLISLLLDELDPDDVRARRIAAAAVGQLENGDHLAAGALVQHTVSTDPADVSPDESIDALRLRLASLTNPGRG